MDDEIILGQDGPDCRYVGGVTAHEDEGRLQTAELRELAFKLLMGWDFACDHPARRHAGAVSLQRRPGGFNHGRMFVEAQVIAPCEVEARLALDRGTRTGAPFLRTEERAFEPNESRSLLDAVDVAISL